MLNYIKSEWYRMLRGKGLYALIGGCAAAPLAMNLLLAFVKAKDPGFPYGTVRFSFNTLLSSLGLIPFLAMLAGILAFGEEYKHKTMKNTVSFGISRERIFLGKCLTALMISALTLAITGAVYGASACLLLEPDPEVGIREFLEGIAAALPSGLAGLALGVTLSFLLEDGNSVLLLGIGLEMALPAVCNMLGLKFQIFYRIARWMPYNIFNEGTINMGRFEPVWRTPDGLMRCILAGFLGLVIFYTFGLVKFRQKEI